MAHVLESWEQLYQKVTEEPDVDKLTEKIHAAELAMSVRWQELESIDSSDGLYESDLLRKATGRLVKIKIERLKWPSI